MKETSRFMRAMRILFSGATGINLAMVLILAVAMTISYKHQVHLLQSWKQDTFAAYGIPVTVDALGLIVAVIRLREQTDKVTRRIAQFILLFIIAVSGTGNFLAGGTLGAQISNTWPVLALFLGEWLIVRAKIRYETRRRMSAEERERRAQAAKAKAESRKLTDAERAANRAAGIAKAKETRARNKAASTAAASNATVDAHGVEIPKLFVARSFDDVKATNGTNHR